MQHYHSLRLILGDQLNGRHSWYRKIDAGVLYMIAEVHQDAQYAKHPIQKICAFFAAMENFADVLKSAGHQVKYLTLDDSVSHSNLSDLIVTTCQQHGIRNFEYQQPDEYRLAQQLQNLDLNSVHISSCDSEHFLLPNEEINQYIKPGQHNRMESFYQKMRVRFNVLMEGDKPRGGHWNFDNVNQQRLKPEDICTRPEPLLFANPVRRILNRIETHNIASVGAATESLIWPVNLQQSLELLEFFCKYCLPNIGRPQNDMTAVNDKRWSLYHSSISFALNSKMLHPMQVVKAAVKRFEEKDSPVSIIQLECFIRQIVGWREYVRAMYWANMPEYTERNSLLTETNKPEYFWTGKTKTSSMKKTIDPSLDYSSAHHIRRLMVTHEFSMLAAIEPAQMNEWYLGIYMAAIKRSASTISIR